MIPIDLFFFCSLTIIFSMIKICAYSCLLSALSFVEMNPLSITGHVGKSLTIKCSDWDAWTDVRYNVKYFCDSPCTEDKHVIIKAAFGETTYKNRIEVTNTADGLFVTFTNLQESDSKTYYCGAEKFGRDSYIKVNLKVTKAESYSPKTTPKKVTAGPTLSFTVTDDSITSSNSSDNVSDMSMSHTTLNTMLPTGSTTQGAGYVPYLTAGVILIIIVMVVLILAWKKMKKQQEGRS
ncbi:CMRF-35-like molecule 4 [Epinephelus fuscoguttatus]|uniref:CMRF-35-like molecule 4 n=1 Tax=Epinephelus fuscoguttatus TaxID=293821 RepID=UPI0020D087A2|nr:CMRF-35-like molecule 4 [Epinephelus fuscoguttatus]